MISSQNAQINWLVGTKEGLQEIIVKEERIGNRKAVYV